MVGSDFISHNKWVHNCRLSRGIISGCIFCGSDTRFSAGPCTVLAGGASGVWQRTPARADGRAANVFCRGCPNTVMACIKRHVAPATPNGDTEPADR